MGFFSRKKDDAENDADVDPNGADSKKVQGTVVDDAEDRGKGVRVSVSVAESLSPRGSREKTRKKASKGKAELPGSSRPGVVSGVLSDPSDSSEDTPHRDIVERRFGPNGEAKSRPLPAPRERDSQSPANVAGSNEADAAALDLQELETADLEIDSMAHIGRSTTINGDIVAEEDLEIEGTVEGTVTLAQHRLTVGAEGIVKARVNAASVVVVGRIDGDVTSPGLVEVKAGGYIGGNVQSPRVILQDGAIVIGGLDMSGALPKGKEAKPSASKTGSDSAGSAARRGESVADASPESPLLIRVEPSNGGAIASKDSA